MPETKVILLAEDRDDDIALITKSFERAGVTTPVFVVRDGEEAVMYLSGVGRYASRDEYPLPNLLLLDLKMPRMDGFEVIKWIRAQPGLRNLVIVVLTSSEAIRDVNRAYELGANSFLVKPMEFSNATALSEMINRYWLDTNTQPEASRRARTQPKKENR